MNVPTRAAEPTPEIPEVPEAAAAACPPLSAEQQAVLMSEYDRVRAYVLKHFPPALAPDFSPEDVVQDVFFAAGCQMGRFRPADRTSAFRYLATIARNRIARLMRFRGIGARRAGAAGGGGRSTRAAQTDSVVATLADLAVHWRTPSRSAARHELLAAVERALGRLPAHLAEAVRLRHIDGLDEAAIAARTGRTHRAVHQLCYRGVQMIRRELRSASLFA